MSSRNGDRLSSHLRRVRAGGLGAAFALIAGLVASFATPAAAQDLTIYSTREAALTVPLLERFTGRSGITTNFVHFKSFKDLQDRLAREGDTSPADLVLIPDIGGLFDLVSAKLTQQVASREIDEAIPANLKHPTNMWVGLSYRIRAIYVSKDRVPNPPTTYRELAEPRFQGRFCIRSGTHPYNQAWIAAMLLKEGEGLTAVYLQGLKRNMARTPSGGDRDVAKDIAAGVCDVGIANTYYMGLMASGAGGAEQKKWAEAVTVVIPSFGDRSGAHVNVTGAAVTRHAPNKQGATRLLEYLVSEEGQKQFADANFEYPARASVPIHPVLEAFGQPTSDMTTLAGIAVMRGQANALVVRTDFDAAVIPAGPIRTLGAR